VARFLTTSVFDCEYLWNGSIYRQTEKQVINYNPSHVRHKIGELWTFSCLTFTHPKSNFLETIFRPLGCAASSNFYTC